MCPICNIQNEDEFHIIFVCNINEDVPNYYFIIIPERTSLVELLSSVEHAHQVALYLLT